MLLVGEKLDYYVGKECYGALWCSAVTHHCENTTSKKYMQSYLTIWVQLKLGKLAPVGCLIRLSVLKTVVKWQGD